MIVIYEVLKDYYGEEKHEEVNIADFDTLKEFFLAIKGSKYKGLNKNNYKKYLNKNIIINDKFKIFRIR